MIERSKQLLHVSGEMISSKLFCLLLLIVSRMAQPNCAASDPFELEGSRNIVQEEHFGIVNGQLTSGIRYQNVLGVAGLWAPPYVSSDFSLDIVALGERIPTERYVWHPFHVERTGTVQGMASFDGVFDSAKVWELVSPVAPRQFVQHSLRTIETSNFREAAAAFTFGRKGLLPDVF